MRAQVDVTLVANPSHLEVVDPVLEGVARAKQDMLNLGEEGFTVMPIALHGDAAFAGQGVVAETLHLSLLRGYRTGGTMHVIINNQVGFTTAPEASRSSEYCTDVAKMIQAPIFHVNGDDPEAAVWVARLAVEYRQTFGRDVVIDMVCYRRRGHNEGDDPSMTNPLMYQIIDGKRSVRRIYTEALIGRGDLSPEDAEEALRDYHTQLERVFNEVRDLEKAVATPSPSVEAEQQIPPTVETKISASMLQRIADAAVQFPEGFTPHPRVKSVLDRRVEMSRKGGIDWAFGELIALGSIAMEGRLVRLSGQDTRRGTFVQRHSVLIDHKTGAEYLPLQNLSEDQARVLIYDSALTEYAALGFEYGYSVANRDAMVMWEAQFGDFVNGAQSVIDEYLSSGEAKWGQQSGVVLLLPHAHEGQGPDHTSGPDRAVPAAVRRGLDDGRRAVHPGELLPPAAPARAGRRAPADGGVHPEVDAAQQGRGVLGRRLHRRQVRVGDRRPHRRPGRGQEGPADQRQAVTTSWTPTGRRTTSPTPRSSGWSRSTRCRGASWRTCWTPTRRSPTSAGCRRSRRTRAPGRSWRWRCRR